MGPIDRKSSPLIVQLTVMTWWSFKAHARCVTLDSSRGGDDEGKPEWDADPANSWANICKFLTLGKLRAKVLQEDSGCEQRLVCVSINWILSYGQQPISGFLRTLWILPGKEKSYELLWIMATLNSSAGLWGLFQGWDLRTLPVLFNLNIFQS